MTRLKLLLFLLKGLDNREFAKLLKLLPYKEDKNKRVKSLLSFIRKNAHQDINWLEEQLIRRYFEGNRMKDQLRGYLKGVNVFVEEFVCLAELNANENLKKKTLLSYANRKNLFENFSAAIQEQKKALLEQPIRDIDFYNDYFQLEYQEYYHPNTNKYLASAAELLQNAMNTYNDTYIITSLKFACETHVSTRVTSYQYSQPHLEYILQIAQNRQKENKTIEVLFFCYQLLKREISTDIEALPAFFQKNKSLFSISEQLEILGYCINYVASLCKKNPTHENYILLFELYLIRLNKAYIQVGEAFETQLFLSTAHLGMVFKKLQWASDFITNYQDFMSPKHKDVTVKLCWAMYDYYSGNISKAIFSFNQIKTEDMSIMLRALTFQTLCLMEDVLFKGKNPQFVIKIIRGFKKIIPESVKNGPLYLGYTNFIAFIEQLINPQPNFKSILLDVTQKPVLCSRIDLMNILERKIKSELD